jgi:hypothetical protein
MHFYTFNKRSQSMAIEVWSCSAVLLSYHIVLLFLWSLLSQNWNLSENIYYCLFINFRLIFCVCYILCFLRTVIFNIFSVIRNLLLFPKMFLICHIFTMNWENKHSLHIHACTLNVKITRFDMPCDSELHFSKLPCEKGWETLIYT